MDHRNDVSLAGYGFVRTLAQPLLPATDLPTFDPEAPYKATPGSDAAFYGPGGEWNTEAEYARLAVLLREAQASEEEDLAVLEMGELKDWRERAVVEFRVQRRRALQRAVAAVGAELR